MACPSALACSSSACPTPCSGVSSPPSCVSSPISARSWAAVFPIALPFAVDPSWTTPLLTVALFIGVELLTSNVLEPWLYRSSTGLSPLAIIVAAVFWTTLWGPVGLLLATPLAVCMVVLGRHVPQLQFFEVLLGDQPVLAPEVKFYRRLLAGDPHEAEELAEDLLEERSLHEVLESIVLPALLFAGPDRQHRVLEPPRPRPRGFGHHHRRRSGGAPRGGTAGAGSGARRRRPGPVRRRTLRSRHRSRRPAGSAASRQGTLGGGGRCGQPAPRGANPRSVRCA